MFDCCFAAKRVNEGMMVIAVLKSRRIRGAQPVTCICFLRLRLIFPGSGRSTAPRQARELINGSTPEPKLDRIACASRLLLSQASCLSKRTSQSRLFLLP